MNKDYLKNYATDLNQIDSLKAELKSKKDAFEDSIKELKNRINDLEHQAEQTKELLIIEAKREFEISGKKKLYGGIGIRESTKYNYNNVDALDWAKKSGLCLSLDTKAFEKIITVQKLDFVTEEKDIKVTFPAKIQLED